jgi:uncharacterized oligopeptide transporter (OPT) family protein
MPQLPTATLQPTRATRFQPYVPPNQTRREFTTTAILLGVAFGLIFGASTVYLGLRAGVIAAGPLFFALATVLARVGQGKLA